MDELDVADVKIPLTLLNVRDVFKKFVVKMDSLSPSEANLVAHIETLRGIMDGTESGN